MFLAAHCCSNLKSISRNALRKSLVTLLLCRLCCVIIIVVRVALTAYPPCWSLFICVCPSCFSDGRIFYPGSPSNTLTLASAGVKVVLMFVNVSVAAKYLFAVQPMCLTYAARRPVQCNYCVWCMLRLSNELLHLTTAWKTSGQVIHVILCVILKGGQDRPTILRLNPENRANTFTPPPLPQALSYKKA